MIELEYQKIQYPRLVLLMRSYILQQTLPNETLFSLWLAKSQNYNVVRT